MPMTDKNTENQESSVIVNEEISKNCACSESFFDKKLIASCLISALIAGFGVFGAVKLSIISIEKEMRLISKNYEVVDEKLKNIENIVSSLESSAASMQNEMKSGQENFAYVYSKLAYLQKDVASIKENFHMDNIPTTYDAELKNMSADQISFIESLETLVHEGAPFGEFLKTYDGKFSITTFASGKNLMEFVDVKTLSIDELQKVFSNIAQSEFSISLNETFWEKQKRIIKEKFVNAITIKKNDEENKIKKEDESKEKIDDKVLFANASEYIKDANIEQALEILEKIEKGYPEITTFIAQAKQRILLNKAFTSFKKEFISTAPEASEKQKQTP